MRNGRRWKGEAVEWEAAEGGGRATSLRARSFTHARTWHTPSEGPGRRQTSSPAFAADAFAGRSPERGNNKHPQNTHRRLRIPTRPHSAANTPINHVHPQSPHSAANTPIHHIHAQFHPLPFPETWIPPRTQPSQAPAHRRHCSRRHRASALPVMASPLCCRARMLAQVHARRWVRSTPCRPSTRARPRSRAEVSQRHRCTRCSTMHVSSAAWAADMVAADARAHMRHWRKAAVTHSRRS
jgi:hypothetical protein